MKKTLRYQKVYFVGGVWLYENENKDSDQDYPLDEGFGKIFNEGLDS
jgi:hypothetical protein